MWNADEDVLRRLREKYADADDSVEGVVGLNSVLVDLRNDEGRFLGAGALGKRGKEDRS